MHDARCIYDIHVYQLAGWAFAFQPCDEARSPSKTTRGPLQYRAISLERIFTQLSSKLSRVTKPLATFLHCFRKSGISSGSGLCLEENALTLDSL